MVHRRGSVPLLLFLTLLAAGCFRTTAPAPGAHALSGRVRLIGYAVDSTSRVTGTVVVEDADGVAIELRSGSKVVAHTTTTGGAWRIAGLPSGSYVATVAGLPFAAPHSNVLTLADRDVAERDTIVVRSVGDIALVPNPMGARSDVYFNVLDTEHVTVRVLGLDGTLVRTLFDDPMLAGFRSVSWTGVDETGTAVSGHRYWVVYEAFDGPRGHLLFR